MPPLTAAKPASPALEAVTAWETVAGLVGTCFSIAVSLATSAAPAKASGTVQCHSDSVMWNGVDQKFFWSRKRLRGSDLRFTGAGGRNGCDFSSFLVDET